MSKDKQEQVMREKNRCHRLLGSRLGEWMDDKHREGAHQQRGLPRAWTFSWCVFLAIWDL